MARRNSLPFGDLRPFRLDWFEPISIAEESNTEGVVGRMKVAVRWTEG